MTLVEQFAQAKATGNLAAMVDLVPYAKFLGLVPTIESPALPGGAVVPNGTAGWIADETLITTMHFGPHVIGNASLPAIHGGAIGALLESAAIFELLYRAETLVLPKPITLTIDYLRSAGPHDTHARGSITRHGKRVANVRVEAWQADRTQPVATAHAIFLVMRDDA